MTALKHLFSFLAGAIALTAGAAAQKTPGAALDATLSGVEERVDDNVAAIGANAAAIAGLKSLIEAISADPDDKPASIDPPQGERAMIQVGPWGQSAANLEQPFINVLRTGTAQWRNGARNADGWTRYDIQALYELGHIDRETGLPVGMVRGALQSFLGTTTMYFPQRQPGWDGVWILDWEGDADFEISSEPKELIRRVGPRRFEYTRDITKSDGAAGVRATRVDGPVTSLRLYRKEHEARLNAGEAWNPDFVEALKRYDVIRLMDLQAAFTAIQTRADQTAPPDHFFLGNTHYRKAYKADHKYLGLPLELAFDLGVETGAAIWHHAPLFLGGPDPFDASIYDEPENRWADRMKGAVQARAADALESDEWDKYADQVVAALEAAGYPPSRLLMTTVSNEVWNFYAPYYMSSRYAAGIGDAFGYKDAGGVNGGYGILLMRWKFALDSALERAGRDQKVVYVMERQANLPYGSSAALRAAKAYTESIGERWDSHAPDIGLSVASYWGSESQFRAFFPEVRPENIWRPTDEETAALTARWERALAEEGAEALAKRFADYIIEGPDDILATRDQILKQFADHARRGAGFGVKLIGAYEGGSHLERPGWFRSEGLRKWRREFVWGEQGKRVNIAVNAAIRAEYPDFILSNYVLGGARSGQPWFGGLYGEGNAQQEGWEPFLRAVGD